MRIRSHCRLSPYKNVTLLEYNKNNDNNNNVKVMAQLLCRTHTTAYTYPYYNIIICTNNIILYNAHTAKNVYFIISIILLLVHAVLYIYIYI